MFHFPSGQVEAHARDGRKDILFPDGHAARVLANGREAPLQPPQ
jgi:centromere protein J